MLQCGRLVLRSRSKRLSRTGSRSSVDSTYRDKGSTTTSVTTLYRKNTQVALQEPTFIVAMLYSRMLATLVKSHISLQTRDMSAMLFLSVNFIFAPIGRSSRLLA